MNSVTANAETNEKWCNVCENPNAIQDAIDQLASEGTTTNLTVNKKDKQQIDKITAQKDKEYKQELKDLKKNGFKEEKKADNYITFENLKDEDVFYEKVGVLTQFYIKSNEEIARKQVWIDLKKNEVVRYDIITLDVDGTSTQVVTYDIKSNQDNDNNGGVIILKSKSKFKFNGISFACSASGLIACSAAFGGLTVVVPAVGAVASLGCALAFTVGCSYT